MNNNNNNFRNINNINAKSELKKYSILTNLQYNKALTSSIKTFSKKRITDDKIKTLMGLLVYTSAQRALSKSPSSKPRLNNLIRNFPMNAPAPNSRKRNRSTNYGHVAKRRRLPIMVNSRA